MTDNDVTLPEIYRVLERVELRLEQSIKDHEAAQHSFRNRLEVSNLRVENIDTRLKAAEGSIANIAVYVAKVAGGVATLIGLLFSGLSIFWKKP